MQRFEEAITAYQDAAAIFRETGDRHSEAQTLDNLGNTYQEEMQQPSRAATCWREAAAMRDADDPEEAERLERLAANAQTG